MKCECDSMSCSHYDARDAASVAQCQQEATQAVLFHDRPDGQEMCFECAKDAAETLESVDYVCLECGKKHGEGECPPLCEQCGNPVVQRVESMALLVCAACAHARSEQWAKEDSHV